MKALNLQDRFFKNSLGGNTGSYLRDQIKRIIHSNISSSDSKMARDWHLFDRKDHLKFVCRDRKKNGRTLSRFIRTIQNEVNIESKTHLAVNYLIHLKLNYDPKIIQKIEPRYVEIENKFDNNEWRYLDIFNFDYPSEWRHIYSQMNILFNVHYSTVNDSLIAYYPSLKHYREGREVRTKLGKFLARFKNELHLTDDDIKKVVDNFNAELAKDKNLTLTILDDKEDNQYNWANVYQNNREVHSCMTNRPNAIRTYCTGFGALKLAYLTNGEGDVVSRTIIRDDDKKGYIRFYPSSAENKYSTLLKNMLSEKGYSDQVDLDGIYLKVIEDEYGHEYAPYLDGEANYADLEKIDNKWFIKINYDGEYCLDNTTGYLSDTMQHCSHCDDQFHEDDLSYIGDYQYCESCTEDHFCYSEAEGEYIDRDDAIWIDNQQDYYHRDSSWIVYSNKDNEHYHEDDVAFCEFTEDAFHAERAVEIMFYINGDYFEDYNETKTTDENEVMTLPNGERVHFNDYHHFINLLNGRI